MPRTFEERVGGALDGLYQAALFLSAGNRRSAEELLADTMVSAFRAHPPDEEPESFERWLELRLVRGFLDRAVKERPSPRRAPSLTASYRTRPPAEVGADALFRAAAALPPQPRAALWLVLLRRWGYDDVARALGVERATVMEHLRYRDVLLEEILPTPPRSGTIGSGG